MKLLVIRHAIAEEQEEFAATGLPDEQRPLTKAGAKRMRRGARGLRELVPAVDVLATSPLTRAIQTAAIVAEEFGGPEAVVIGALVPERPFPELVDWLRGLDGAELVAIVGHEPHLSSLVAWLISGQSASLLELKKGAACLVGFEGEAAPGQGLLHWALTPRQLRQLA